MCCNELQSKHCENNMRINQPAKATGSCAEILDGHSDSQTQQIHLIFM